MAVLTESRQQRVFAFQACSHRRVAQGYAAFLTDYVNKPYDMSNEYEVAAYIFGGDITKPPFNSIPNMVKAFKTQVLKAYNIRR